MPRRCSLLLLAFALFFVSCGTRITTSNALLGRAYVWQRQWTPAVAEAVRDLPGALDGIVVLGSELEWTDGGLTPVRANVDWDAVRVCHRAAVAIRIAPLPNSRTVVDLPKSLVVNEARRLIADAQQHGIGLSELQFDFDCPSTQLSGYADVLGVVRGAIKPLPLVVTTLPAWLDSTGFKKLVANCDRYVLQVHSVPLHNQAGLFDPALAQKWICRAATYNKPFAVALPTYRCVAGYAPDGHLLGVTMDSVQGRWPPDTRLREIAANPDDLADAVAGWRERRPWNFCEVLWYRLPVASDMRNWRMATLAAVANGRRPERRLELVRQGMNPVDIAIRNTGEADEVLAGRILLRGDQPVSDLDALEGWHVERRGPDTAFVVNQGAALELRPGETRSVGWVRTTESAKLEFQIIGAGL